MTIAAVLSMGCSGACTGSVTTVERGSPTTTEVAASLETAVDAAALPFPFPAPEGVTTEVATEPLDGRLDGEFALRLTIHNRTPSTLETMHGLLINPSSETTGDGALRVSALAVEDPDLVCGPNCDDVRLTPFVVEAGSTVTFTTRLSGLEAGASYDVAMLGVRLIDADGAATFGNVVDTFVAPG